MAATERLARINQRIDLLKARARRALDPTVPRPLRLALVAVSSVPLSRQERATMAWNATATFPVPVT